MKKYKVVVDLDRMKYPNTGMFEFCYHLYNNFKKNSFYNFVFYKHTKTALDKGIPFIEIGFFDRLLLLVSKKYDLWHVTNQLSSRIPANAKKMVYTIHDLNFLYSAKNDKKKDKLLQKIQKNIYKADYLTFISEFTFKEVKSKLDISNKKYSIIYNGVTTEEPKESPKIVPENPFLFSLGVIDPKKNIHTILNLLGVCDYDLVIAGKISNRKYYDELVQKIKNLNLQNRVIFTDIISNNDKFWYYQNCEAFIFPSISEGFGIPPIEAMRFGKPVFLSKLTSLPEIGGKAAYYFDNFEPTVMQTNFLEGMENFNNDINKKMSVIKWSEKYTWEKACQDYISIYKDLLET